MKAAKVPTAIYYPIPLSRQIGYKQFLSVPTPVSERICGTVVSLPMHPDLDVATQDRIISAVLVSVGRS